MTDIVISWWRVSEIAHCESTWPFALTHADLNGDGVEDLVVANSLNDNVSILFGLRDGTFTVMFTYQAGWQAVSVVTADVDFDNETDIFTANQDDSTIAVLKNDGPAYSTRLTLYNSPPGQFRCRRRFHRRMSHRHGGGDNTQKSPLL
nr:VCBS repeat-containing protein [candidate division KSB1 bacterium]NIR72689.1 VCBS repeat-containing protein [candidate division KSB1 bacterium]NIS26774.1 VCBS repeat-containing protein [candidate division KSB1 bacterium]NIT73568.1 VCBS repeat-containing protein [candidate division KSB1 bacterium]NIU27444.1 VCBS repeat-containing protein [candidate division KSB1 bacterium]